LNTEIGVYCQSPVIASQVVDGIEPLLARIAWHVQLHEDSNGTSRLVWIQTADDGTVTKFDKEPEASTMRRVEIWFLGLLPIESQF
jgi:cardiolipin synthase C